ncbi:putative ribonuclease H-like domain-containing protein [Tanacetum coccineum]
MIGISGSFLAFASYMRFTVYQMDVKSAFLYGTIEEEVYVHQPPSFVDHDHLNKFYKVVKALYGLHQAPRAWYETLSFFLLENGFRRGTIDKTLFIKKTKSDIMLVQVYVDDIIFGSTKKSMCTEFEEVMHKRFQMSSMGELTFFLGLQVKQQPDGIFISQDKYVADILKKFDFCSIKTATTPIESNKPLVKDEDGVEVDVHEYRSMIGSLMYLTASRPDIMFAVCASARFQVSPKASYLHAVQALTENQQLADVNFLVEDSYLGSARSRQLWQILLLRQNMLQLLIVVVYKLILEAYLLILWIKVNSGSLQVNSGLLVNSVDLRYALTHNPTIYDSLVKQFWQTATVRTLANGTQQLVASIDSKEYTITEASVRSKLQLADATGIHNLSDAEIYAGLATLGPKSGGWDQFGSTIATALICLSSNRVYNFSKMIFDGMVHNLESNSKILMYPRFLQIILDITTENKGRYLAPTLTKKLFANMKRGYAGDIVPLLPAMLAGAAVDQGEGSAQPAEPHHTPVDPIPSTSHSPHPSPQHQSPPHSPLHHSPYQSPPHSPHHSPPQSSPHFSPPRSYEAPIPEGNTSGSAEDSVQLKKLMVLVPKLVTRINSLEKELKETKQTLGDAVVKLVKKVKSLETALKRKSKKVIVSASESEELKDQGRIIQDIDDDPLVSLVKESMKKKSTDFVTPTKASGEAQEEEISPTILRRARSVAKNINIRLDAEEEINTEDWDAIKANLEANAELTKDVLRKDLPEQDFAKRMAEMFKKLKFEEIKEEFDMLVLLIDTISIGYIVIEVKEGRAVKKTGKRKKQKALKRCKCDKSAQEDSETIKRNQKLFKTPSLDKSSSLEFDLFYDLEENPEEVAETMAKTMEQYMRKTQADYGSAVSRWLRNKPSGLIKTWEDIKAKFLSKYCPPAQTAKKMEEINKFQQEPNETLYQVIMFYNGMEVPTRQILDSKGAIPTKTTADAKVAIQEMTEYSQKWHNGTSRTRSTKTSDGLAAIQSQLNNRGREIKKANEKVYAAQVGCELCKGPHYTKDCPFKEAEKTLEEAYYTQFGVPFQQGWQYSAAAPGFYQRNNANPSYQERSQSMEESLSKRCYQNPRSFDQGFGNSNRANKQDSVRKGSGSLPSSTETNPRDHVNSISTIVEADKTPIRRIGSTCYARKGSYGLKDLDAYSIRTTLRNNSLPKKEKDPGSLGELARTKLNVELVDETVRHPKGIAKNVLLGIGKFVFPVEFIILDMPEDVNVSLILGRPFLSTAHAKVDVFKRNITLRVGD